MWYGKFHCQWAGGGVWMEGTANWLKRVTAAESSPQKKDNTRDNLFHTQPCVFVHQVCVCVCATLVVRGVCCFWRIPFVVVSTFCLLLSC